MQAVLAVLSLLLFAALVIAAIAIAILILRYSRLQSGLAEKIDAARHAVESASAESVQTRMQAIQQDSQQQLKQWREQELTLSRQQQLDTAHAEAQVELTQWKAGHESAIRQDAIDRSRAVITGKITEHFVPYLPEFSFNPKDARFIGTPIDMVVFDGLDAGNIQRIVFIEVKTGASALSHRERLVRDAIQAGKIEWLQLRPNLEFRAVVTPKLDGSGVEISAAPLPDVVAST